MPEVTLDVRVALSELFPLTENVTAMLQVLKNQITYTGKTTITFPV